MNIVLLAISFGMHRCVSVGSESNVSALINEGEEWIKKIRTLLYDGETFSPDGKSKENQ